MPFDIVNNLKQHSGGEYFNAALETFDAFSAAKRGRAQAALEKLKVKSFEVRARRALNTGTANAVTRAGASGFRLNAALLKPAAAAASTAEDDIANARLQGLLAATNYRAGGARQRTAGLLNAGAALAGLGAGNGVRNN